MTHELNSLGKVNKLRYIKTWVTQTHATPGLLIASGTLNFAALATTVGHWQNPTVMAGIAALFATSTVSTVMAGFLAEVASSKNIELCLPKIVCAEMLLPVLQFYTMSFWVHTVQKFCTMACIDYR